MAKVVVINALLAKVGGPDLSTCPCRSETIAYNAVRMSEMIILGIPPLEAFLTEDFFSRETSANDIGWVLRKGVRCLHIVKLVSEN